ncbi:hypothetical protein K491DRAFT_244283 [Lophiostoma macrostomum CBS 122681]|uniref:Uncharacterized protein n=1 Tax=Lophiostoma macrostomum CBS 122681 TaxID=1314788 RepID=A0A6A6TFF4_9PLEO|nr:hypothetical protein K491DRAFT_244283 [Lophiostoma macrostomum CBS 122681]
MASPTQNPQDQQATVYPEFAHLLLASPSLSSSTPSSLQNSTSRPRERRYGQILPSTFSVLEHTPPARPSNNPYIEPAASPSPIESPVLHIPGAFHLTPQPQPQPAPETPQLPELDENYSTPASPDSDLAPLLPHEISAFAGPSTAVHATQQQHHQHQESDQDQQQHLGHSKTHRKAIQRRSAPDAGRLGADTPHPAGQLRRHSYHPHPDPVQDPVYQASAAGTGELELHGPVARCCSLSASRGRVTPGPASTPALDPAPSSSNPAQTPAPAPAPPTSNPPPAQTPAPTPPNPTPPSRPPPQLTPYPYPDNRRIPHAITGQRPRPFHAYPPPVVATNPRYPVERGTERTASLRLACLSAPPEAVEEDVGDYTHFSGERTQMVRPSPRPRSARFTEEMGLDGPACFAVYGSEGEEDLDWRNVPMRRLPE